MIFILNFFFLNWKIYNQINKHSPTSRFINRCWCKIETGISWNIIIIFTFAFEVKKNSTTSSSTSKFFLKKPVWWSSPEISDGRRHVKTKNKFLIVSVTVQTLCNMINLSAYITNSRVNSYCQRLLKQVNIMLIRQSDTSASLPLCMTKVTIATGDMTFS